MDEFHLLGDRSRGGRLEGTISRFTRLNPFARVLGLSATIGNRGELADWISGVEYGSDWRPAPLRWRIARYRKADEKPSLLVEEVLRNVRSGGKSLVFVQSRRRAEELGRRLQAAGLKAGHHHAGLAHPERHKVEAGFRSEDFEVVVCTSTLEMGLNLPARQVVLYDLQAFDGEDFRPLSTNSVWQRVGRAGRPGLDPEGEAILLAPTWDRQANRYQEGSFEPIQSRLSDSGALAEQVVAEVAGGLCRTLSQLKALFSHSLAARQGTLPDTGSVVEKMCEAGMLEQVQENEEKRGWVRLRATRLGKVAARHMLAPETVLLLRRVLESGQELSFYDLLLVAASAPDCEPVLPVDFEELDALASSVSREVSYVLRLSRTQIAELLGVDGKRLLSALKMAVVVRVWTRTSDAAEVADEYDCYPFEVNRLRESFERLLLAACAVLGRAEGDVQSLLASDIPSLRERLCTLGHMVSSGIDESAATLALIDGIGAKLARRLQEAGMFDIEDLAVAEPEELSSVRGVSEERAERWISAAADIIQSRPASAYKENGSSASLALVCWPSGIDPYRLRRALDLSVEKAASDIYTVTGGLSPT